MSPRTLTKPPTDKHLWRLLLARAHPDAGGSAELFVWTNHVRELVCGTEPRQRYGVGGERQGPRSGPEPERILFHWTASFDDLTSRAVEMAEDLPEPYALLLCMLEDCATAHVGPVLGQQQRGATWKQAAAIAYRAGMSKEERRGWYRVCEDLPLSQRHAGHIIGKLVGEERAA